MLRLANALAKGTPGVRPEIAERIVAALNDGRAPARAHARLARARPTSRRWPTSPTASSPTSQLAGEGGPRAPELATRFSTGIAALAVADVERLLDALDVAGALDLEAFAANLTLLHPAIGDVRPYPGLVGVARAPARRCSRAARSGSPAPRGTSRTRSPSACLPQVHGALRDALAFARGQLEIELNASQENPLIVPDEDRIVSVANFDILPLVGGARLPADRARLGARRPRASAR